MVTTFSLCFDRVLCYKMIALHPDYVQVKRRLEERVAALKESGHLYEDKNASYSTSRDSTTDD